MIGDIFRGGGGFSTQRAGFVRTAIACGAQAASFVIMHFPGPCNRVHDKPMAWGAGLVGCVASHDVPRGTGREPTFECSNAVVCQLRWS